MFDSAPSPPPDPLVNAQLEQAVLGALLVKPGLIEHLNGFSPDAYAIDGHADIHRALADNPAGGAIAVMKMIALGNDDLRAYIAGLAGTAGTAGTVVSMRPEDVAGYAAHVMDLHRRRKLVQLAEQLKTDALTPDAEMPTGKAVMRALDGLDSVSAGTTTAKRSISLDDAMDTALQAAEDAMRRQGPAGLSTGFPSIDAAIGGLEDGTLTVLAGRPGMGKSAFGWQIALWVAQSGVGVLAVSLEMSAKELGRRALCAATGIPISRVKSGRLSTDEASRLVEARRRLTGLPLTIEDGGGLTAAAISMKARSAHRRHGLGLVMIDHLHIVAAAEGDARHGPTHAVGTVSTASKRLAKEFNVPVLLLAQLNRGVEGREDKRPTLADLRQSGNIEQDADAVGFLFREEYYLARAEPERLPGENDHKFHERLDRYCNAKQRLAGKAEFILAKLRDGAPCTINLAFDGPTTSFMELPDATD